MLYYTTALNDLLELYVRGGCSNRKGKPPLIFTVTIVQKLCMLYRHNIDANTKICMKNVM